MRCLRAARSSSVGASASRRRFFPVPIVLGEEELHEDSCPRFLPSGDRKTEKMRMSFVLLVLLLRLEVVVSLSWSSLGLSLPMEARLMSLGLAEPTAIQALSIPRIVAGEDVVISAETGSGKTLAYVAAPLSQNRPTIVVAPSQALCSQIRRVVGEVSGHSHRDDADLDGERRAMLFLDVLNGAVACAVVTPKDALVALERVASGEAYPPSLANSERLCVIFDEADALLKPLGKYASPTAKSARRQPPGERVAEAIFAFAPKAQLVGASATIGRPLRRQLENLIPKPLFVARTTEAKAHQRAVTAPKAISAHLLAPFVDANKANSASALEALDAALKATKPRRCLVVLANPQDDLRRAVFSLRRFYGFDDATDLADADRTINNNDPCLYVAPLRLLRGIDVPKLDLVIVLGRPKTPDDYLHAAGRTGRQGHRGLCVTLAEYKDVRVLESWTTQLGLTFDKVDSVEDLPACENTSPPQEETQEKRETLIVERTAFL